MKQCNICKEEKELSEFMKRGTNAGPYCKKCKREYDKEYWKKTKSVRNSRKKINAKTIRERNSTYLWNYLKEHPCVDCGETDPIVLEFDHLRDKKIELSNLTTGSIEKIQVEIDKCEVRCANCHRRKTAKEQGWYKYILTEI